VNGEVAHARPDPRGHREVSSPFTKGAAGRPGSLERSYKTIADAGADPIGEKQWEDGKRDGGPGPVYSSPSTDCAPAACSSYLFSNCWISCPIFAYQSFSIRCMSSAIFDGSVGLYTW